MKTAPRSSLVLAAVLVVVVALASVVSAQFRCPLSGVLFKDTDSSNDESFFFFSNFTNNVALVMDPDDGRAISALGTWTVVSTRDVTVDISGQLSITQEVDMSIVFSCRSSRNNDACLGETETLTLTIQFNPACDGFRVTAISTTCATLQNVYRNFDRYSQDRSNNGCGVEGTWDSTTLEADFYFSNVATLFTFDSNPSGDISYISTYTLTDGGFLVLKDVCGVSPIPGNSAPCSTSSEGVYEVSPSNDCNGISLAVEDDTCLNRRSFFDQAVLDRLVTLDGLSSNFSPTPQRSSDNDEEDTNSFSPLPTASNFQIPVIHLPSIFFADTFSDGVFVSTYRGRPISSVFTSNLLTPALYTSSAPSSFHLLSPFSVVITIAVLCFSLLLSFF